MIEIRFDPNPNELIKSLQLLSKDLQVKALRSGIVSAIKPVKAAMKQMAPKKYGGLAGSIGHVNLSGTARGRIGAGGQIAILVGVVRRSQGRLQYRKAIWHDLGTKKMKATPFIDAAFKATEAGFDGRFYKGLGRYLKRAGFA